MYRRSTREVSLAALPRPIGTSGQKRGTMVMSLPLVQASLVQGSAIAARVNVTVRGASGGIMLSGFPGYHGGPGTYYVGLGPEPAAAGCAGAVEAAIRACKNPV